jgi:glycosyltransferase involved in cell wall biosynthesis
MSNCIPVASRTGFSSDIIKHGVNGYLFDVEATYSDVIPLIEKAFTNNNEIRSSVLENTWENCSERIDQLFLTD